MLFLPCSSSTQKKKKKKKNSKKRKKKIEWPEKRKNRMGSLESLHLEKGKKN
jgi:hypothetical protein